MESLGAEEVKGGDEEAKAEAGATGKAAKAGVDAGVVEAEAAGGGAGAAEEDAAAGDTGSAEAAEGETAADARTGVKGGRAGR